MELRIKFSQDFPAAFLPSYATAGSAGLDLVIPETVALQPQLPYLIDLGLAVEIPEGFVGLLTLRSSIAKEGIILGNAPGIIDSDYRGNIKVLLVVNSASLTYKTKREVVLQAGQRIAQLLVMPCQRMELILAPELGPTARAEGGFGSTGA